MYDCMKYPAEKKRKGGSFLVEDFLPLYPFRDLGNDNMICMSLHFCRFVGRTFLSKCVCEELSPLAFISPVVDIVCIGKNVDVAGKSPFSGAAERTSHIARQDGW